MCLLEAIVRAGGEEIRPFLTYLPRLADLLRCSEKYVESWFHEFYASLWIHPDHEFLQHTFRGHLHRLHNSTIREKLHLPVSPTMIHDECFGSIDLPRRAHGGWTPSTDRVVVCFKPPFGEGSRRTPSELTPIFHLLNDVMGKTLLPRMGYKEGLSNLQLFLLSALVSQTGFDIVDFIICEMEDTIADGIQAR